MVNERVKILYVIGTLRVGGAERHLLHLLKGIDKTRFEPEICCIKKQGEYVLPVEEIGLPVLDLAIDRYYSWKAFRQFFFLVRHIRKKRFHIVHTFLFHTNFFGALAAFLVRKPRIVISIRNMNIHFNSKHIFAVRFVGKLADRITVVSEQVKQMVLKREKLNPAKIVTIPNGVDVEDLKACADKASKREALHLTKQGPVLGCVANLAVRKGHRYLIEAMAPVVKAYPDTTLLLIGEGNQKEKIADRVRSYGLTDHVRFLNRRHDVLEILEVIDIFVLPSLEEGMSNALLEAVAKGRPAVVTDVGGNGEVVVHGETGLVVPPRSPEAMADAILRLLRNPEEMALMGSKGRERIHRLFSIREIIKKVQSLYADLLSD